MKPLRQAAVVVPVCGRKALILERAAQLRFQPGFHSFPGGLIESSDHRPAGPGPGPVEARRAALRELVEETGLTGPGNFTQSSEFIRRNLLEGDGSSIDDLVAGADWSRWRYLGVWTTPEYANIRFETHFFACGFEALEQPVPNEEVAQAWWIEQGQAHAAWRAGDLPASPPVLAALDAAMTPHEKFKKPGDARDLLFAGGAVRYLPLMTPTLPPATHTNCSFIGGDGAVFVVDPAPVAAAERALLWREIERLENQGEQLKGVILTHLHHDHLGAASWLAQRAEVPILGSAQTQRDLARGLGGGLSAGGHTDAALPQVNHVLNEGDCLPGDWRVLLTPGHAKGHLCLWHETTRSLVAGDMIASGSTILIEPEQGNLRDYLASLERLASLKPSLIIPAHGLPLARGEHALLALRAHRLMREDKVVAALARLDPASLEDLVALAYDDTPSQIWPLAALSLHSHLIKLASEGRAFLCADGRWSVDDRP